MNVKEMGALIDYLRTVNHDCIINACYDGYIFVQDDSWNLDSDIMFNLGFVWDRENDWYAFDADRGV